MTENMSRRSFITGAGLLGAAVVGGTSLIGCAPKATEEKKSSSSESSQSSGSSASEAQDVWKIKDLGEPKETVQADVCIVGGGGTGLAAAIQCIDLGLKPLVIEREGGYGGSFVGTEGMTGFDTKYTNKNGEKVYFNGAYNPSAPYDAKNAANTCLNFHHWIPQQKLYANFFSNTADTIDWLESHGVKFEGNIGIGIGPKV